MLDMVAAPPIGRAVVVAHSTPPGGAPDHRSPCRRAAAKSLAGSRRLDTIVALSPLRAAKGFCEEDSRMMRAVAYLTVVALAGLVQPAAAALSPPHLLPAMPGVSAIAETQMEVSGPYANLRAKPTTQAKLLAKLDHATKVEILGKVEHDRWYHVKANGIEGYIRADLLK
jgi:SH3 domain-containing protein